MAEPLGTKNTPVSVAEPFRARLPRVVSHEPRLANHRVKPPLAQALRQVAFLREIDRLQPDAPGGQRGDRTIITAGGDVRDALAGGLGAINIVNANLEHQRLGGRRRGRRRFFGSGRNAADQRQAGDNRKTTGNARDERNHGRKRVDGSQHARRPAAPPEKNPEAQDMPRFCENMPNQARPPRRFLVPRLAYPAKCYAWLAIWLK
jgi:hypothetical protein